MHRRMKRILGLTACAALSGAIAGAGGCVSYTPSSGDPETKTLKESRIWGSDAVVAVALREVLREARSGGGDSVFIVNLPAGTTIERARRVLGDLPEGTRLVEPRDKVGTPADPVFHVARVWIRGTKAKVDVVGPRSLPDGSVVEAGTTVWLHGGALPWRVERTRRWAPGVVETPKLFVPIGEGVGDDEDLSGVVDEGDAYSEPEPVSGAAQEPAERGVVDENDPGTVYREVTGG